MRSKRAVGGSNLLSPASPTHLADEAGIERGQDGERTEEDEEEVEGALVRDLVCVALFQVSRVDERAVARQVIERAVLEETRHVVERDDHG